MPFYVAGLQTYNLSGVQTPVYSLYNRLESILQKYMDDWGTLLKDQHPPTLSLSLFSLKGRREKLFHKWKRDLCEKELLSNVSIPVYQNTCQYPCGKLMDKGRKNGQSLISFGKYPPHYKNYTFFECLILGE